MSGATTDLTPADRIKLMRARLRRLDYERQPDATHRHPAWHRPTAVRRAVPCPDCRAGVGKFCTDGVEVMTTVHPARDRAALRLNIRISGDDD